MFTTILVVCLVFLTIGEGCPDVGQNTIQMIQSNGYPVELHTVNTTDGYILQMQRIPHGKNNLIATNGTCLLMHGFELSSADWVNHCNLSLAFILADQGCDVWLGNARGTSYSRAHRTLDPNSSEYWKFSHHEIGKYDLTSKIDYILSILSVPLKDKLKFICHSHGCAEFLVMASEMPEYNNKVEVAAFLGPTVFMGNTINPAYKYVAKMLNKRTLLRNTIGSSQFQPATTFIQQFSDKMCQKYPASRPECESQVFVLTGGFNPAQFEKSQLEVIESNAPAGAAARHFEHCVQSVQFGTFAQFDYLNTTENLRVYNETKPPSYDLSKVTTPHIAIYFGGNDWLATKADVEKLNTALSSNPGVVVEVNNISDKKFTGPDFLWAKDVMPLVYNDVVALLSNY